MSECRGPFGITWPNPLFSREETGICHCTMVGWHDKILTTNTLPITTASSGPPGTDTITLVLPLFILHTKLLILTLFYYTS